SNWVKRTAEADGSPTLFATVTWANPLIDDKGKLKKGVYLRSGTAAQLRYRTLSWLGGPTPVASGGVLDRLQALSKNLAELFMWKEDDATHFILTGWPPELRVLDLDMSFHRTDSETIDFSEGLGTPPLSQIRIMIKADPWVTPNDIRKAY